MMVSYVNSQCKYVKIVHMAPDFDRTTVNSMYRSYIYINSFVNKNIWIIFERKSCFWCLIWHCDWVWMSYTPFINSPVWTKAAPRIYEWLEPWSSLKSPQTVKGHGISCAQPKLPTAIAHHSMWARSVTMTVNSFIWPISWMGPLLKVVLSLSFSW